MSTGLVSVIHAFIFYSKQIFTPDMEYMNLILFALIFIVLGPVTLLFNWE